MMDFTREYELLLDAYAKAGGDRSALMNPQVAHLIVHKNRVIGSNAVEGLEMEVKERERGIKASMRVLPGYRIPKTVHLCFGLLPKEGTQEIELDLRVEDGAGISILAHCIFPNAVKVRHLMSAEIEIGDRAWLRYQERHFHGEIGGVEVVPRANVVVGRGGLFYTEFILLDGRVGKLEIDYDVSVDDEGVMEMIARVNGRGDDEVRIREIGRLRGRGSSGMLKTRVALRDEAKAEVYNELIASGPESRGHVDCKEIVRGGSIAKAIPVVTVAHPTAQVTHEAAIGTVDRKQLLTLMARGLEEEEAVDVIVKGMLGE